MNELEELNLLNQLIELGAKAAHAHAQSNSDDGHKGTAAYVQWQELRAEMGELIRAAYAPQHPPTPQAPFQQRVQPWLLECFGAEIAADRMERNHRFLEESLELVQSLGCTASEAHQLVDYVFGRAVGDPPQEVGGVMVTLAALCLASGLDMHDAGEVELARISVPEIVAKIRAKQAAKPKHSPLPQSPTPQADSQPAAVRDERDDFEKVFPLPSGCIRVGIGYASTGYSNWAAHTHVERWQGWQARAARATADSVAAPAGGVGAWRVRMICCGKDEGFELFKTWDSADAFRNEYTSGYGVEQHGFSAPEHSGGHRRAAIVEALCTAQRSTQPAQAADSVLEDAARLDFLCGTDKVRMIECEQKGLWRVYQDEAPPEAVQHHWQAIASDWHTTPRAAIDAAIAARKQGGAA